MYRSTRILSNIPLSSRILGNAGIIRPGLALSPLSIVQRIPATLARRAYSIQNPTVTNPTSLPNQQQSSQQNHQSPPEPEPTSAYGRFKLLAKKYGWYAFGMYWILSTIDFTLSFAVVHSLGAERIEPILASSLRTFRLWRHGEEETRKLEEEDIVRREEVKKEAEAGGKGGGGYWGSRMFWAEVVLAYTIHKTALLPFRAGLTAAWTPKVVKWLRARGWAGKGTSRALAHAQSKLKRKPVKDGKA